MAEIARIEAASREDTGRGAARKARRAGDVPGILYGNNAEPKLLLVSAKQLSGLIQHGTFLSTLYELDIDGEKQNVLPREVQLHPVTDVPLHVDFMRIASDARLTLMVTVNFVDEEQSPGLRRGGVLNIVRHDIEVTCLATSIPEIIEISLADLDVGDSIHISAVKLPEGVEPTIRDRDFTIATIAAPRIQEELVAAAEEFEGEEGAAGVEAGESEDQNGD